VHEEARENARRRVIIFDEKNGPHAAPGSITRVAAKRSVLYVVIALWAIGVAGGLIGLVRYTLRPGEAARAPRMWPAESAIAHEAGRPTLVMIAHPKCPCTRASLAELARLLAEGGSAASAHVVFVQPDGASADFVRTDTYARASAIPGVVVHIDKAGVEAGRFGASTSGETLLYDGSGRLIFHGGITDGRGHEGANAGRRRIRELLASGASDRSEAPTFGCELSEQDERGERRGP
jgi:hypothetical protein